MRLVGVCARLPAPSASALCVAALALVAVGGAAGFARHPEAFLRQPDFALTYIAAKATERPDAMYEPRAMAALARAHRVNGYAPGNWFLYPPGVAILFLPFAALPLIGFSQQGLIIPPQPKRIPIE